MSITNDERVTQSIFCNIAGARAGGVRRTACVAVLAGLAATGRVVVPADAHDPPAQVIVEADTGASLGQRGRRPAVVLREFPVRPDQFQPDLQPLVKDIIARHGIEEWQVNVLTSELHRHLGLYSIVGAKMGLRARELLSASLDELRVESLAGLEPPLSCLNDGLQVATGASLGRGTIRVPSMETPQAAAVFTLGGRRLRLRVRDDALKSLQAELRDAIGRHGDLTPAYFAEVRRLSLKAWRDLDRTQLFEAIPEPAIKVEKQESSE
jgi:formylmethanofuran dehydrogenase subunit E